MSPNSADNQFEVLADKAKQVAFHAHNKLSGFAVGAAIMGEDGQIYTGCNIEFDNYSNTIHAEESAISAMVSAGCKRPKAIAVYTSGQNVSFPCGMCLQSLGELGGPNLIVIAVTEKKSEILKLNDLLPKLFKLD